MTHTVPIGGERLDRIARDLMQTERRGTVEALLNANPGLAAVMASVIVPEGTVIRVPAAFEPAAAAEPFVVAWE